MSSCHLQVDLKFPRNVSDGARDLISKLLRHSPVDRLSLQSVIDHPWVRANSHRLLPPSYPTKKSWAHLASLLTSLWGVFYFLHKRLWVSTLRFTAMGFKLPLFWHILWWVYIRTHFFYVVQCGVFMYCTVPRGVCVFIVISFLKRFKIDTAVLDSYIWWCWHQSTTIRSFHVDYIL